MGGRRVLIAGGGTGGHIMPALRIGHALEVSGGVHVDYCCGRREIEARVYSGAGVEPTVFPIDSQAGTFGKARYIAGMARTFGRALVDFIANRPATIVATGGAVCFPILSAAVLLRVPFFLHESNAIPGRVVRLFARFSTCNFTGFEIPGLENQVVTGTPGPRAETLCDSDVVLCVGGSQGAARLNELFLDASKALRTTHADLKFVLIAGNNNAMEGLEGIEVLPYCDDMPTLLSRTRLIVSRSGSGSLSDIAAFGLPAVLVPFPFAKDDHQAANARHFEDAGAAIVLKESEISSEILTKKLDAVLGDGEGLGRMARGAKNLDRPEAAREIARAILAALEAPAAKPAKLREGVAAAPPKS